MHDRKAYFILPTSDYNTEHIKLGQIITDMHLPYRPLSAPLAPVPTTSTAFKNNYVFKHSLAVSGSIGLQAQCLAQLGSPLGADASVSTEKGDIVRWEIDRLETEFIEPPHTYVKDSVLSVPAVKTYLEQRKLMGAVYMVTGVKVVKGLKFVSQRVRGVGVGGGVTVDAAALTGVPVSGGPQGEVEKKVETEESYGSCSDFVFAYRVQRMYISWFWGKVKAKEKVGGDLAGVDDGGLDEDDNIDIDLDDIVEDEPQPEGIEAVSLERDMGAEIVPDGFVKLTARDEEGQDEGEDFVFQKSTV